MAKPTSIRAFSSMAVTFALDSSRVYDEQASAPDVEAEEEKRTYSDDLVGEFIHLLLMGCDLGMEVGNLSVLELKLRAGVLFGIDDLRGDTRSVGSRITSRWSRSPQHEHFP